MRSNLLCVGLIFLVAPGALGAEAVADAGGPSLTVLAPSDTVRTNLWLAQALMREIVEKAATSLPPAPCAVALRPLDPSPAGEIFTTVAARVLGTAGYELYLAEPTADTPQTGGTSAAEAEPEDHLLEYEPPEMAGPGAAAAAQQATEQDASEETDSPLAEGVPAVELTSAPTDVPVYELQYRMEDVQLAYPESGRRFGIWRQWVARQMHVATIVTIVEQRSGRLLLSERLKRSYRDRVPSGLLAAVRSDVYPFTDAELGESTWRRRLEQFVVLGTLTGLVAVYFANTGE
jgi:hypothetical protein